MRHFVIDTDTASDDAVALLMALRHPGVTVDAVTVVAGNVSLDQAVQNALYTVELCGSDTPVYAGAVAPLLRDLDTAQHVHGQDGMGDVGLPPARRTAAAGHAVNILIETFRNNPGGTLVCLGPLTNIALAIAISPDLRRDVGRCVVMGGVSDSRGNITALGEYNFWADPDAAQMVMRSGLPLELVGWDISRKYAVLDSDELRALRELGPLGQFAVDINREVDRFSREVTKLDGPDFPDPIAMAIALAPDVATASRHLRVDVDNRDGWGRGQTIIDHDGLGTEPANVKVTLEASRSRFLSMLHQALRDEDGPCLPLDG